MIPDASDKIRQAAGLLSAGTAKTVYGYLEGDILRHVRTELRKDMVAILVALRAEMGPGVPTWSPDVPAVKAKLLMLAERVAEAEPLQMSKAELARKLALAREEGRAAGLDEAASVIERKESEAFLRGQELGRQERKQTKTKELSHG